MDNKNVYEVDYSENEKKGRLLSLISIFINIVSVIVAFIGLFPVKKRLHIYCFSWHVFGQLSALYIHFIYEEDFFIN